MADISTLVMNDANSGDWENYTSGSGTISQDDTETTHSKTTTGAAVTYRQTKTTTYDIDATGLVIRKTQVCDDASDFAHGVVWLVDSTGSTDEYADSANGFRFYISSLGGTVVAQWWDAGSASAIGGSQTEGSANEWLRVRVSGGTLYAEYAADSGGSPGSWTEFGNSSTTSHTVTGLRLRYGMYQQYTSTFTQDMIWDQVNESPASGISDIWQLYGSAIAYIDDNTIQSGHQFKVGLLSTAHTLDLTSDTVRANVATEIIGTDATVTMATSATGGLTAWTAGSATWATSAGLSPKYLVLYDDTPTSPADPLVAAVELSAVQVVPASTTLRLPSGIVFKR